MIKLIHEKEKCIGCGACSVICEKHWKMGDDMKAHIIGGTENGGIEEKEISEQELECNKEAAEMCPVNCIHIEKEGKRII